MPYKNSSNNRILPANSRAADVAEKAIKEIVPIQQARYLEYASSFRDFLELPIDKLRTFYQDYHKKVSNDMTPRVIRHLLIEIYHPELITHCLNCNSPTSYSHDLRGYRRFCNRECQHKSEYFKTKVKEGFIKKVGMTQHEFLQSSSIVKLRNKKLASKETKNKRISTNRERFGCDNAGQNKIIRGKIKNTCLARYGAEHHFQSVVGFQNFLQNGYKTKKYITKDNRVIYFQGYEPIVANILENRGWDVKSPEKSLDYVFKNKHHVYHPDMVIRNKANSFIIEVKSLYTLFKEYRRNQIKFKTANRNFPGKFLLIVPDIKKKILTIIKNPGQFNKVILRKILLRNKQYQDIWRLSYAFC